MHHNPGLTLPLTLTLSLYLTHVKVWNETQNLKKYANSIYLVIEEVHFLNGTPEFLLPVPQRDHRLGPRFVGDVCRDMEGFLIREETILRITSP